MNARYRALFWEECRVGGAIAATCAAVGMLGLSGQRLSVGIDPIRDASFLAGLTVLYPFAGALLLLLQTVNSGHLDGGFSRRVLLLPVETWAAVGIALVTRLLLVLVLTAAMLGTCQGLFGKSPAFALALLPALVYLYLQTLDWLRRPAPIVAGLGLAAAASVAGYVWLEKPESAWQTFVPLSANMLVAALVLASCSCLAYGVSVWAVGAGRYGQRFALPAWLISPSEFSIHWRVKGRFRSRFAAQVWFELRGSVLLLPVSTVVVWALLTCWWWASEFFVAQPDEAALWTFSNSLELLPLFALLFAAANCGLSRWGMGLRKRDARHLFAYLYPATSAEMAMARLAAGAIALVPTVLLVAVVTNGAFLLGHERIALDFLSSALGDGGAAPREIAALFLGAPILFGLAAWVLLHADDPFLVLSIPLTLLFLLCASLSDNAGWGWGWALCAVWFGLFVLYAAARLAVARYREAIPARHFLACLAIWAGVALFLYPFSEQAEAMECLTWLATSMAGGALAILPYPMIVLRLQRLRSGEAAAVNPAEHARRTGRPQSLSRRAAFAIALMAMAGFLAWLRWPAEPAYRASLRAQGYPATLSDLSAWYPEVPANENLATRYIEASRFAKKKEREWEVAVQNRLTPSQRVEYANSVLVQGDVALERTETISENVWNATFERYEMVDRETARLLREVAASGLSKSRYPMDIGAGFDTLLDYLSPLRSLGRSLSLDALVAAMQNRPHDAAEDLLAMIPLANSLDEEPLLISQLVRVGILGIGPGALETVLNRAELPPEDLARLEEAFAAATPSSFRSSMFDRAIAGERILGLDASERYGLVLEGVAFSGVASQGVALWRMLGNLAAYDWFECLVLVEETGRWISSDVKRRDEVSASCKANISAFGFRTMILQNLMPISFSVYATDWRCRAALGSAQTACAIERYRLQYGRPPQALAELVPEFIETIPIDPWNDWGPLSYRLKPDGEYVVYSVGRNHADEGGVEHERDDKKKTDDWTFTVAPPEVRSRLRVIQAAGAAH